MRYYNSLKNYYMPVVGDEPNIIDDNSTDTREIKIECIRFFVNNEIVKNIGDTLIIQHKDAEILNNWFSAITAKTVRGFTTFKTIVPNRSAPINIEPSIISGSWEYDGESETFKIPLLSPVYANDNIKCSLSNITSNKNVLIINPNTGTIEVTREV